MGLFSLMPPSEEDKQHIKEMIIVEMAKDQAFCRAMRKLLDGVK